MLQKIRVITIYGSDLKGESILSEIKTRLRLRYVNRVQSIKVYRLEGVSLKNAKILAEKLLSEAINQKYTINSQIVSAEAEIVEIGYKSGVMNPEVASITKTAGDLKIKLLACDSSTEFAFFGNLSRQEAVNIVEKLNIYNKTVEQIVSKEPTSLLIEGQPGKTQIIPIRSMTNIQLMQLSKDKLFLNLEEMQTIKNYFTKIKKDPTDLELETLAQTWSEHSGHKTFKAELVVNGKKKEPFIERIKKEALKYKKNIVSAFVDNSGVMDFYDGFGICGKVETHNAPSAIEPYGGAMTGSGGVFRDIAATGKGAKTIASTDIFCFAPLNLPAKEIPEGCLPPDYLLKRAVAGVKDYGNRMGIPTNNGSVHFHPGFRAKPSVIVGAYGIMPKKYAKKGVPKKGDLIICVGGRTGRDGIHGATFSSGEMTEQTVKANSPAVQIGNAIEEKRMFDALLEARDRDLIILAQDCGGGGFSSAIGEIGENLGVSIDVQKAPLKYQGLSSWEIWVSESQERMIVVLSPNKLKKFEAICKKYNVENTILGKFDGSRKLNVYFGQEKVSDLDMKFLHHGLPKRILKAKKRSQLKDDNLDRIKLPESEKEWYEQIAKTLAHGNVCSKESIIRLYDHSVQGTCDLQPYAGAELDGPNDSPVLRPFLDKKYGVVIAHGLNPVLSKIDPYWGSIWAGVEAVSNFVAVGGDYKEASFIENFIWPFPDEESLWDLDRSVDAVIDLMKGLKIPVISGKDSLSSTYRGRGNKVIKIPPTLCMSVFGKIKDVTKTVTADFKSKDSTIVLVGKLDDSLGGSIYLDVNGIQGNNLPRVDLKQLPKTLNSIYQGIQKDQILSCHDISEGGVIAAIFEMCVGGSCGVSLSLGKIRRADNLLFNETAGTFIVEVANGRMAKKLFKNAPFMILGKTRADPFIEAKNGKGLFKVSIEELKKVWQQPMRRLFA